MNPEARPRSLGRYTILGEIGSGGMATVFLGGLDGPSGITQKVAIKRLHAQFAKDPEFVSMFLDEARIATQVHHANVVRVFEVLVEEGELFLVMEYIRGETLAGLLALAETRGEPLLPSLSIGIAIGALAGLHAAHEARDDHGQPLGIVHRDVSPQNILIGVDGVPRILDFGVAKAVSQHHTTRQGQIKGKLAYMAPEQRTGRVDRCADVYAMGVVLWEMLTGRRLFQASRDGVVVAPGTIVKGVPAEIDGAVLRALAPHPEARFATARDFAIALEEQGGASTRQVGEWVVRVAGDELERRQRQATGAARDREETAVVAAAPRTPGQQSPPRRKPCSPWGARPPPPASRGGARGGARPRGGGPGMGGARVRSMAPRCPATELRDFG
jgi:serine/threonine-protein kinase